ncbi:MAG TPA: DUF4386 domain-containing protein [Micropepsaceae bacterium]|nr:DUF4386 domain-containing protein [Micropepsaceae bacterium]
MDKSFSPGRSARLAGFLYLIVILGGAFAEAFVRQRLMVIGDAPATAANLIAGEQLMRLAFAADVIPLLCNLLIAALFYRIFRVVSREAAALTAFFMVAGSAIQAAAMVFHIAPLVVLKGSAAFAAFDEAQLQSLAYLFMRLHAHGYTIALIFFGGFGLSVGYLLLRSSFLPRALGVFMVIAGACYFANSMLHFVAPELSSIVLLLPVLLGEGSLTLWLIFAGLNEAKWRAQAEGQN